MTGPDVMRQPAFLVVNPITVNNFASHLLHAVRSGLKVLKNLKLSWLAPDALSLVGPTELRLLDFLCSGVSVLVLLSSTLSCLISVLTLDLHVLCLYALISWKCFTRTEKRVYL